MKITTHLAILLILIFICSCDNQNPTDNQTYQFGPINAHAISDSVFRLRFDSEEALKESIQLINSDNLASRGVELPENGIIAEQRFKSLMSQIPTSDSTATGTTYYEALGYDSLVPNTNFARLLNIHGELEVNENIVKITKQGTFIFPKTLEKEANEYIQSNPIIEGTKVSEDSFIVHKYIKYIKTFDSESSDYSLDFEGNYSLLPDDYFETDSDKNDTQMTRSSISEPNFNDFTTFSANKKTFIGKKIENIIGNTKAHTINFNSHRRVRGSFYFYNYGVYAEIGIKGWTDKKNWIGWSKVECDELRVGWRNVIINLPMPADLKKSFVGFTDFGYEPPRPVYINNKYVYTAMIVTPDLPEDIWDKIKISGQYAIKDYIKNKFQNVSITNIDLAEAFVIATPNKLRFVASDGDIIKYNTKSFCHVFAKDYMDIKIEWNESHGFYLNNLNVSNLSQLKSWITAISKLFTKDHLTLISGETYVCARMGDQWRGMKIIRKESK